MPSNFRFGRGGVSARLLGITTLIAILFVAGCTTNGGANFTITTTSASLPAGSVTPGAVYPTTNLAVSNGTGPFTWAVTGGALPPGLALSATGTISGVPTAAGTFNFTVTVTDSATPTKHTATANLTINISPKLTITSAGALTTGEAGASYSATLVATGGIGPFTWAVATGNLPGGLSLSGTTATGTIGSTISSSVTPGAFNFTAKITDSQGGTSTSGTITITVDPAVAITAPTLTAGVVGVAYSAPAFTGVGGSGSGYSFALASGALPGGLSLGASTGLITGPPTTAGTSTFTVKVTDSLGFTATTGSLSIIVDAALAVTTSSLPAGAINSVYPTGVSTTFAAVGGVTPYTNWTVSVGSLPAGLILNAATGAITGSPTGPASNTNFTVRVTDSASNTATKALSITVNPALAVSTASLPAADVSSVYTTGASTTLAATGGVPPYTAWAVTVGSLPAGLNLNTVTGAITGTPTGAPGTSSFTVKVTDTQGYTATKAVSILVNAALTVSTSSLPTGVINSVYSSTTLTATGGATPYASWAVTVGTLPAGLNLNTATGAITGTPTGPTGTVAFTVQVTDAGGYTATKALSILVNGALSVTTSALPTAAINSLYPSGVSTTLAAADGVTPYTNWAVTVGNLPAGLHLNAASGAITGTPTGPTGPVSFTVQVTDSASNTATKALSITVNAALAVSTSSLPNADVNSPYTTGVSTTLAATGGVPPYTTWAVTVGNLPTGMNLNPATGAITGTPTGTPGTSSFTVQVTDSGSYTATKALSILVNPAIAITPPTFPTGVVNNIFTVAAYGVTGGQAPFSNWVVSSGSLPTGLLLNGSTGQITGTPTVSGTFSFKVSVTDGLGNVGTSAQSSITVNAALSITTASLPAVLQNAAYSQTLQATGGITPYTTWAITVGSLPTGLSIGPTTGTISGSTSVALGNYPFTAQVTDSIGDTATQALSITVTTFAITTTTLPAGTLNVAYAPQTLALTGGTGPFTWTITTGSVPGLSLAPSTGILSGTPTSTGTFPITVQVKDSATPSHTATANLSITVNGAPAITSANSTSFTIGTAGSFNVTTTGFPVPAITETLTLPTGVSFHDNGNGTATLSWTAAVASGSYGLSFTASNSVLPNATQAFTLSADAAPAITSLNTATFTTGTAGSFTVTTTGFPVPALTETLALPTGVTFHDNGNNTATLSWTVAVAGGSYSLSFTASNGIGSPAVQPFTLKANAAPAFTSNNSTTFTAGTAGSFNVTTSGFPVPAITETLTLPTGVSFHDNGNGTATLSWTAAVASGSYGLSFTASNGVGSNATQAFTLSVNAAPAITSPNSATSTAGTAGSFMVTTTGFPVPTLSETLTLASGISFTNNGNGTGTLSWTAAVAGGVYNLSFTASNGVGSNATQTFTLTLNAAPAFTSNNSTNGTAGTAGSFTVTTTGFPVPSLSETLTLPTGVSFHDNANGTGTLSWTSAVAVGVYGLSFTASNTILPNATQAFTLNIALAGCTTTCQISGTITGPWVKNVSVAIAGPTNITVTTDANGNYTTPATLHNGTYTITPNTVTPVLQGYNFAPTSITGLSVNSVTTGENFTESSVISSFSISGTVSGSSDSTHVLYITVFNCGGGTNCNPVAGTTLPSITTNGGAYTVRGLSPSNNYSVRAEIDTLNNGAPNEADPAGTVSGINITGGNATGANITIAAQTVDSPGAPGTPTVFPGGGAAFVTYNPSTSNTTGDEIATSYTLHYGTSSGSLTQSATIPAGDSNQVFILPGLVNGTTYFFAMSATNSKGTSVNSATTAGVLINSSSGAGPNTISGTVTFNVTPNGSAPLYVGLYSSTLGVYFERIAPPFSSGVAYSIPGVPSGNYQIFAVLDQNDNDYIDAGDVTNFIGANGPPPFVVSASSSGNTLALTAANAATFVTTNHTLSGSTNTYAINVGINLEQKLPVSMTMFSGPNVAVPFDMDGGTNNNNFQPIFSNSVRPTVGDLYQFLVTYSDGTTQVLSSSVSTVLDSFAQNLLMNSPVAGSATVPVLNWAAPAAPPSFYTYKVEVNNFNGSSENWDYPNDSNGLPIGSTNVQFNKNGNANPNAPLIGGETYNWAVTVLDANSNTARVQGPNYTVPGGSPLSPVVTVSFNPTSILVSGSATLVFNINNPNGSASLSGIAFSDTLTGGLTVVGSTPTNSCGATLTGTGSGSTSINVSNVSLAAGASCQVGINVTSGTTGTVNNQTSTVTSNEAGTGSASNTASLSVGGSGTLPPTIGVAFNPSTITVNFSTTLTFTINNPNGSSSLSGVTFTDNLPSNLFVLSPNNGLSGSCGSGTISAVAGSQLISLTNGTLGAGGGCTFSVNVTATATGTINDTTGNISSNEGGTGGTSNTAALTVNSGSSAPAVLISGLPNGPFFAGGAAATLTLTVSNDAAGDVLTPSLTVDANTGLACSAATCGTIGAVSGTSGSGTYTVPYTPPASLSAETLPTINVSSSLSGAFAATTSVDAYPAGQTVVTVGGVSNIVQVGSAPPTVKMIVYNDIGNAGVNELPLTSVGFGCSGLNGNSCGTLNDHSGVTVVDNGTTTTTTFTYSPPATVPSEPFNRPRIVAASVASPAVSGQRSFLLSSTAEPTPLSIPFAQKFNTVLTNSAAFAVTANLNGDSGNSRTINWTINANGSPCAPPTCGTLGSPAVVRNGGAISSTVNLHSSHDRSNRDGPIFAHDYRDVGRYSVRDGRVLVPD